MNIVLVGVWGAGVSALAYLLHELWYTNIVWINNVTNQITDQLTTIGMRIIIGHGSYHVLPDDIVIYSNNDAINSPEVQQSFLYQQQLLNKYHRCYTYAQFLWEISKVYKTIGFAGTNGKSTSTSLGIYTFAQLTNQFGIGILGALVPQFDGRNMLINKNKKSDQRLLMDAIITWKHIPYDLLKKYWFLIEADEYKRHFLELDLDYALITNIELDHSDVYHSMEDYRKAFVQMIRNTRHAVYMHTSDDEYKHLLALNIDIIDKINRVSMTTDLIPLDHLFGYHNQLNALLVSALFADVLDIPLISIYDAMKWFTWLWRRLECLGSTHTGAIIYTDYAHYATSLDVVEQSLRSRYPDKKIVCIFQPHQARRVCEWRDAMISALSLFDEVYIYPIYIARNESLQALKDEFPHLPLEEVNDFDQLGRTFATDSSSVYIANTVEVIGLINYVWDDTVLVVCTAGDLDYELRQAIWQNDLQITIDLTT